MKIVNIFAIINKSLYSVQFEGSASDEFDSLFDNWQDVEYLEQFFEDNKEDLQNGYYGNITIEDAVFRTIEDAQDMEQYIKSVAKQGQSDPHNTLHDLVFKPLHKNDFTINLQESKAYGKNKNSWLRLYAIRISTNVYVVSGGAIKLTKTIQERSHTNIELQKLKITADYLKEIGLITKDDFEYIEISSNE